MTTPQDLEKQNQERLMKEVFGNGTGTGLSQMMPVLSEKIDNITKSVEDTHYQIKDIKSSIQALLMFKAQETTKETIVNKHNESLNKILVENRKDRRWFIGLIITFAGVMVAMMGVALSFLFNGS